MAVNKDHLVALDKLGFVHRRLPTGDKRNGKHFVPRQEFYQDRPALLAVIEDTETRISMDMPGEGEYAQARFTANTPAAVINQAAAAMMKEIRI